MKYCILPFFLFACFATWAQEPILSGIVLDQNSNKPIIGARVSFGPFAVETDFQGRFKIHCKVFQRDTIKLEAPGYRSHEQLISPERNYSQLQLKMIPNAIMLDNVSINAVQKRSASEKYNENKTNYRSIYLKGDKSKIVQAVPLGIGISINKLFSAFSKEGKDARRLQKHIENDYKLDLAEVRFNKELVSNITGLVDKDLDDFIEENHPSYVWLMKASDYDIITYIKEKYKTYNKTR